MRGNNRRRAVVASLVASAAHVLTGCGSVNDEAPSETASASDCGTWGMAMHAWNGYTASAQVVTEVAKAQGCTINQTTLEEAGVTYDAMEAGSSRKAPARSVITSVSRQPPACSGWIGVVSWITRVSSINSKDHGSLRVKR